MGVWCSTRTDWSPRGSGTRGVHYRGRGTPVFTPPALSQQLAKLERELGCALLERGRNGVRLTEAGRVLLDHGERVLGELREAERAVRATLGQHPSTLSLGAFASAGTTLLPSALAESAAPTPTCGSPSAT